MNLLFSFPQQPLSFVREGLRGEERSSWGEEKNYHEITKVRRRERYKFFFRVFVLSRFRDSSCDYSGSYFRVFVIVFLKSLTVMANAYI
jgi:hypothetical protein